MAITHIYRFGTKSEWLVWGVIEFKVTLHNTILTIITLFYLLNLILYYYMLNFNAIFSSTFKYLVDYRLKINFAIIN